jgi:hypothetical protein
VGRHGLKRLFNFLPFFAGYGRWLSPGTRSLFFQWTGGRERTSRTLQNPYSG